jgi:PRTRC genetic system protein A
MLDLDPRDAVLQAHTPAVMVPRYSALPIIPEPGHRCLVAADGLWLELLRPWIHLRTRIARNCGAVPLPYGKVVPTFTYAFAPGELQNLQRRFVHDAIAALPDEFAAWGVWDEQAGRLEYRPLIADIASPGGIDFHRPRLDPHEHMAIDLHSHGIGDAFFSAKDDKDDAGEVKISVVVGTLDKEPSFATRLCLLGLFVDSDEVFIDSDEGKAEIDQAGEKERRPV